MKKFILSALAVSALVFTSCDGNDDDTTDPVVVEEPVVVEPGEEPGPTPPSYVIDSNITEDTTLDNGQIWTLDGRVAVENGVTLTIEPGTIIKGEGGTGANASTLIIAQGATLMAEGTAAEPIIFTSIADDIAVGETVGTNLSENQRGLWGGLIVLGNAPVSVEGDAATAQIEGIPASDINGLYGGSDADDNSGVLEYISIRHGGASIGDGNEINGLTLGGVGAGTTISYIEVIANVDDGIEFFGGTVDASNLLVWACGDDHFDIDQAYSGSISNIVSIHGAATDHALEIDGPEGSFEDGFSIENATLISFAGDDDNDAYAGEIADFRDNAQGSVSNVLVTNFAAKKDVELDNEGVVANYTDGSLSFTSWEVVLATDATLDGYFTNKVSSESFASDVATAVTAGTVGADTSAFSWTFASSNSAF